MPDFVKVLDKGGVDVHHTIKDGEIVSSKEVTVPGGKVLLRFPVDAAEIIASDPNRFELADDDAAVNEDHLGNAVRTKAKKAGKSKGK
jgi:hypothetical protein